MLDWHSSESGESIDQAGPLPWRQRLGTSEAQSESLVGSYMAAKYPLRFRSVSESGKQQQQQQQQQQHHGYQPRQQQLQRHLQETNSIEYVTDSLLLQLPQGTSWWAGVLIMANCTIGMGLLNFPRAVHNAGGVFNAMLIQVIVLFLIMLSLYMVARCSEHYGCVSFQDMVTSHVGRTAGAVCRLLIFTNNFGACIVVLVVLGDQFEMLMKMVFGEGFCDSWYMRRTFCIPAAAAFIILPFCLMKNFDFFKYISFLGVLAAIYIGFGVGMVRAVTGIQGVTPHVRWMSPISSQLVSIVPVICFAYECHVELPPMYACLKRQTLSYMMRTVIGYVAVSFIVYTVGGIGGYIALGEDVAGDFLLSYPAGDKLVIVAMALISMKGLTTYPVIFYCCRTVIDDLWRQILKQPKFLTEESTRRIIQTVTMIVVTVVIAIFVPSISVVISLLGGVSACFVFVFPGLCYMNLHLSHAEGIKAAVAMGAAYTVLGTFLLGCTSATAIRDFGSESSEPVLCP